MKNVTVKTIRKILGFTILMIILLWGRVIVSIVEAHAWVGVVLLLCAVAYVLWGMFWSGEKA